MYKMIKLILNTVRNGVKYSDAVYHSGHQRAMNTHVFKHNSYLNNQLTNH